MAQIRLLGKLTLAALFACAAAGGTPAADTSERIYRVGLLESLPAAFAADPDNAALRDALWNGLRALGYVRGKNLVVEIAYSDGSSERLPQLAGELIARKVDLIVVTSTPAGLAAKQATSSIPILFPMAIDPVGTGLVASLAQPGGNVTGLTTVSAELSGKRLELLRQVTPRLSQVAVIWNPSNAGNTSILRQTQEAAQRLHISVKPHPVGTQSDFPRIFAAIARQRADALLVLPDPVTFLKREEIAAFAIGDRLPSLSASRDWVLAGGLMSYGADYRDLWHRAAAYADKLLKRANPATLPVEQVSKLDLTLNLRTARALRITIPPSVLVQASEVVK